MPCWLAGFGGRCRKVVPNPTRTGAPTRIGFGRLRPQDARTFLPDTFLYPVHLPGFGGRCREVVPKPIRPFSPYPPARDWSALPGTRTCRAGKSGRPTDEAVGGTYLSGRPDRRREKQEFGAFPSARRLLFNDGGFQPPDKLTGVFNPRNTYQGFQPSDNLAGTI